MVSLYRFFQSHKWLLYTTLILTTVIFCVIGVRCRFEENIAKLLPPTDSSLNIDLAFSDLKVKDKLFVQVVPKQGAVLEEEERDDYLIGALDMFMQTVKILEEIYVAKLIQFIMSDGLDLHVSAEILQVSL